VCVRGRDTEEEDGEKANRKKPELAGRTVSLRSRLTMRSLYEGLLCG